MQPPVVSVLLPVRNGAQTLAQAATSILCERAVPSELVIVEDGSTDSTGALCRLLAERDSRVRIVPGPARGIAAALNAGLTRCRGRYVTRMDADDVSLPGRIEKSVATLEQRPALWGVGTQVHAFSQERPVSPGMQRFIEWLNGCTTPQQLRRERFIDSPLCHPSVTLRREALERLGGYPDDAFAEDYALWLRIVSEGGGLCALDEVLLHWRDGDGRLTRTDARYSQGQMAALKAQHLAKDVLDSGACIIWGAGVTGRRFRRLLLALGVEVPLLVDVNPGKVGQSYGGTKVIPPEQLPPPGTLHLVSAVGAMGARAEIRRFLEGRGYVEGTHFTCVA